MCPPRLVRGVVVTSPTPANLNEPTQLLGIKRCDNVCPEKRRGGLEAAMPVTRSAEPEGHHSKLACNMCSQSQLPEHWSGTSKDSVPAGVEG